MLNLNNEKSIKIVAWADIDVKTKNLIRTKNYKTKKLEELLILVPENLSMDWLVLERLCYPFGTDACRINSLPWKENGIDHRVYAVPNYTQSLY